MAVTSIARSQPLQARARTVANRRARARVYDKIATGTLWGIAGFITLSFLFVVLYTLLQGLPHISWQFLTSGDFNTGIGLQIFNTFYLLFLSLLFMVPVGVGAAIYIVEYARNERFLRVLRFATETLTSTPTLIVGFFGFIVFSTYVYPIISIGPLHLHGLGLGFTRISGALTLAVLNVPWMLRTAEDALRAVPRGVREASLAMGATKWQSTIRVVLPAAIPGLVTSILIVAGRVIGETAALIYTTGATSSASNIFNPALNVPGETLAYHAYVLFAEPTQNSENLRLGTALVLIVLVLLFNVGARIIGAALNRHFSGKQA